MKKTLSRRREWYVFSRFFRDLLIDGSFGHADRMPFMDFLAIDDQTSEGRKTRICRLLVRPQRTTSFRKELYDGYVASSAVRCLRICKSKFPISKNWPIF